MSAGDVSVHAHTHMRTAHARTHTHTHIHTHRQTRQASRPAPSSHFSSTTDKPAPTRSTSLLPETTHNTTSSLSKSRVSGNLTIGQQFSAAMPRAEGSGGPHQLLVLRGLRVRMGIACGVERQDVVLNGARGGSLNLCGITCPYRCVCTCHVVWLF